MEIYDDKKAEMLSDVVDYHLLSNCCSAAVYMPTDEWAQCMECKEYCDIDKSAEK